MTLALDYCNDANMNVTALVSASGAVVERVQYDPSGKPTFYRRVAGFPLAGAMLL